MLLIQRWGGLPGERYLPGAETFSQEQGTPPPPVPLRRRKQGNKCPGLTLHLTVIFCQCPHLANPASSCRTRPTDGVCTGQLCMPQSGVGRTGGHLAAALAASPGTSRPSCSHAVRSCPSSIPPRCHLAEKGTGITGREPGTPSIRKLMWLVLPLCPAPHKAHGKDADQQGTAIDNN